jgi:hypothetical protein
MKERWAVYPILALFSLLLLTWGAAVWASYAEPTTVT